MRLPYRCLIAALASGLGCADHTRYIWPDDPSADPSLADPSVEEEVAPEQPDPAVEGANTVAAPAPEPPHSAFVELAGAEFEQGPAPAATPAAALPQIMELTGPSGVTNGGTVTLRVTLDAPFAQPQFVVSVAGDSGYHTVAGTDVNGDGILEIEVQVRADAIGSSIVISVAPTDGMGQVGKYRELELPLVPSGVGDVKITLSFEPIHDLDLHVFEPGGAEISFQHPTSPAGGKLDLDSGANCRASVANAENIFWPPGAAPAGEYRVTVHEFEQCDRGAIDFTVRIENGALVDTYRNTFTDRAEGSVIEVARFTH
jgi:hypothetical protein